MNRKLSGTLLSFVLLSTAQAKVVSFVEAEAFSAASFFHEISAVQEGRRGRLRSQHDQSLDFQALYEAHEWMKLRDAVRNSNAPAFYRGAVAAAFNDVANAEKYLTFAINASPESQQAVDAYSLLTQTYIRVGQYPQAVVALEHAMKLRPDDSSFKNARTLFATLNKLPRQSLESSSYSKIQFTMRDGNMFVPFEINETGAKGIVDTGANFSLVSASEAKRLGLVIRDADGATIGDSSGADVPFQIAVADSLTVGKLRLKNVIFFVMRDDQQPFVELPLGERIILGFPVLYALKSLRWDRAGNFEIGFPQDRSSAPNMWFEGSEVVFQGEFNKTNIAIFVDTGATRTRVLSKFAKEFPSVVAESGVKGTDRVTGVGSSVEVESMMLPELKFRIADKEVVLQQARVLMKDTISNSKLYHVWIGMDLLSQPHRVAIDFRTMSFRAE